MTPNAYFSASSLTTYIWVYLDNIQAPNANYIFESNSGATFYFGLKCASYSFDGLTGAGPDCLYSNALIQKFGLYLDLH